MCIFCEIASGNISCYKVYEDDYTIAFLDLSQATPGHTLVIPKKHFDNILEVDEESLNHVMATVKLISNKLIEKLGAKGVNILNNCGEIAGQSVMHFHVHVIPRYENDKFAIATPINNTSENEFNNLLQKLK